MAAYRHKEFNNTLIVNTLASKIRNKALTRIIQPPYNPQYATSFAGATDFSRWLRIHF